MKLEQHTIKILKNFSEINPNFYVKPGGIFRTVSRGKTMSVIAKATVQEFENSLSIYDLGKFLNCLSIIDSPELIFPENNEQYVNIVSGDKSKSFKWLFASPDILVLPPDKDLKYNDIIVNFTLTDDSLLRAKKATAILGVDSISFSNKDGNVTINSINTKADDCLYSDVIGQTNTEFKFIFNPENLNLYKDDYRVTLFTKVASNASKTTKPTKAAHFVGINSNIEYWVVAEIN